MPNATTLEQESDNSGYKRPVASVKNNPVTVRVTSHSQPPLGSEKNHYGATQNQNNNPSLIPPPTTA